MKEKFQKLEYIEETSKVCEEPVLVYVLLACLYTLITIAATTDAQLSEQFRIIAASPSFNVKGARGGLLLLGPASALWRSILPLTFPCNACGNNSRSCLPFSRTEPPLMRKPIHGC